MAKRAATAMGTGVISIAQPALHDDATTRPASRIAEGRVPRAAALRLSSPP
jgi:hypothetical protein